MFCFCWRVGVKLVTRIAASKCNLGQQYDNHVQIYLFFKKLRKQLSFVKVILLIVILQKSPREFELCP
jgi:hypothetical protein